MRINILLGLILYNNYWQPINDKGDPGESFLHNLKMFQNESFEVKESVDELDHTTIIQLFYCC